MMNTAAMKSARFPEFFISSHFSLYIPLTPLPIFPLLMPFFLFLSLSLSLPFPAICLSIPSSPVVSVGPLAVMATAVLFLFFLTGTIV